MVLPVKPGDDFWWIDSKTFEIHHEKGGIKGVVIYEDGPSEVIDRDGERCKIGTPWCCVSLEQAQEIRSELMKIFT